MNPPSGAQHQQGQEPKMLLGKRPRPPPPTKSMRRTTSMGGMVATVEPDIIDEEPVHPQQHGIKDPPHHKAVAPPISTTVTGAAGFENEERFVMMSPSSSSTIASSNVNSPHVTPTPHFLRTCGLCKRSLAPGLDIYMYRGDTAFCSLECREKQMRQDERKDQKLKVQASNKQVRSPSPPPPSEDPTNTKSAVPAST